jgi:hypothetical protein
VKKHLKDVKMKEADIEFNGAHIDEIRIKNIRLNS